jgi:hypothetical protein
MAGASIGSVTFRKVVQRDAPSAADASAYAGSRRARPAVVKRKK